MNEKLVVYFIDLLFDFYYKFKIINLITALKGR